jgi:hypothetical protein
MFVLKRDGRKEPVHFDKITRRIQALCDMAPSIPLEVIDPAVIAQHVIQGLKSGMTTSQLDSLASETLAYKTIDHPAFGTLAARIEVSNLHKTTAGDFGHITELLNAAELLKRLPGRSKSGLYVRVMTLGVTKGRGNRQARFHARQKPTEQEPRDGTNQNGQHA